MAIPTTCAILKIAGLFHNAYKYCARCVVYVCCSIIVCVYVRSCDDADDDKLRLMVGVQSQTDSTPRGANRFASLRRRAIRIIEVRDDSRCAHEAEMGGGW